MQQKYRIGLIQWQYEEGIRESIHDELVALGHDLVAFPWNGKVPDDIDVLFFYGPFGKYLPILQQIQSRQRKPVTVFWNTEGLPDPNIPWVLKDIASRGRSWLGRTQLPILPYFDRGFTRFRYMGDFFYASRHGWLDVFFDISAVYAQFFNQHNLHAQVAPFGTYKPWYDDLNLERDIDVLWMGKHGSRRRRNILFQIREDLQANGFDIYMADSEEHPFIYDEERTIMLNRTKITLNLLRTWYDENSLRFCMAMPNRSLCVTETLLPHVTEYEPGVHYVSVSAEKLSETILYYLRNEAERERIADNARDLMVNTLTMNRSLERIMNEVDRVAHNKRLNI